MSSAEGAVDERPDENLPPPWESMWRLFRFGFRREPRLLLIALGLTVAGAFPDALFALWFKLLAEGVLEGDRGSIETAALGLALSATLLSVLNTGGVRLQRRFRDRISIALEVRVAELQASIATVAHQERPVLLDRLAMLRDQVFVLDHMYMSAFGMAAWIVRLVVTIALLMSIHPALALLGVCGIPIALAALKGPVRERAVEESVINGRRLATHLFQLATTAPPGKEVRVTGIGPVLVSRRRTEWERWYHPVARARWVTALWNAAAWAIFGFGYVGAVVFVATGLDRPPGDVLLVLAAGQRLSAYVGATVGELGFLRGFWMEGARRFAWLEDYAAASVADADEPVPARLTDGITLDGVSFAYPGTDTLVLEDVSVHLPAGSVVAVVGENGAGKTTLVKLLSKLYEPTAGEIRIDGAPLARMPADEWRDRLAGAYQDFFRFELRARHSVGVGDVPRHDELPPVRTAVGRAGADDVVERLAGGLETQLGPTWPEGVEVSYGQWQKVALARGFMRDEPLLLVLDEPTAALDAETEHALFERYAAGAREERPNGRITVLVSHRFSTVRMADLIVVLDGARVVEVGPHEELLAAGGTYAELYTIQRAAYQ
jgi:ATP-binding cassette, subfamily B, bacterial